MNCRTRAQSFATAAAASRVKAHQDKRHGANKSGGWHRGPSVVYRCKACGSWHIGHSTNVVKNRKPRHEPVCDWSVAL